MLAERKRTAVHAPRGTEVSCKGWQQEAAMRMLMNNLDPEVAEKPDELIVYGGSGKAARSWPDFDRIVANDRGSGCRRCALPGSRSAGGRRPSAGRWRGIAVTPGELSCRCFCAAPAASG